MTILAVTLAAIVVVLGLAVVWLLRAGPHARSRRGGMIDLRTISRGG